MKKACGSRPLQSTCLKPHFSLRYQLFVSFGLTSALATIVVVVASIWTVRESGESVKNQAESLLTGQVEASIRSSSAYVARTVSTKFDNLGHVAKLLTELTRDRIVGYPDQNYEDDRHVPFRDAFSGENVYPLRSDLLPPEWNISQNVNEFNFQEHTGAERWEWYAGSTISTAHAAYRFQGTCNPDETDPTAKSYYENCTDANNDVFTGGVVQPTETNRYLAEKSADLGVLLKPLYEAFIDAQLLGIYFANSGAGSSVVFPPSHIDGTNSYESIGCGWMNAINPFTDQPYATDEEIRRCHTKGEQVPARQYNPMERGWCRDQALQPQEILSVGPYLDAFQRGSWLLTIGTAVFDRLTGHFVACTLLDVSINQIADILENSIAGALDTELALVRWDSGTVVASSEWNASEATETMHVTDLSFMDQDTFDSFRSLVDFESEWDPSTFDEISRNIVERDNGNVLAVHLIPIPPMEYDVNYRPDFLVIQSIGDEVFSAIDETNKSIDDDVLKISLATTLMGAFGLVLVLLVTWTVSNVLTRPLQWIESVSKRILSTQVDRDIKISLSEVEEPFFRCTPKSEVTELVSGFRTMIMGFSGEGAALIATSTASEVKNELLHQQELANLYYQTDIHPKIQQSVEAATATTATLPGDVSEEPETRNLQDIKEAVGSTPVPTSTGENQETKLDQDDADAAPQFHDVAFTGVLAGEVTGTDRRIDPSGPIEFEVPDDLASSISSCTIDTFQRRASYISNRKRLIGTGLHAGYGRNVLIQAHYGGSSSRFQPHQHTRMDRLNQARRSRLFWWIVSLIVAPLLITMTAICTLVVFEVSSVLPSWLDEAEIASRSIQQSSVDTAATALALFTEVLLADHIKDLHLLGRVTEWLLFGGLLLSSSMVDLEESTEECKAFPMDRSCPFFANDTRSPCDCAWNDLHGHTCRLFESDSRYLQKQFYAGQSQDADPLDGSRWNVSYPKTDFSPENTSWWNSLPVLPGYENGLSTTGHSTAFDRLRSLSSLAAVIMPIYNHGGSDEHHHVHHGHEDKGVQHHGEGHIGQHVLGAFVGLEADGMLVGYNGCEHSFAHLAHFQSTAENGAADIRPDLCPLGKYGYDSRCRGWYSEGKALGKPYMTPPYVFAGDDLVAMSATAPLTNPSTGEHVGQVLVDFIPTDFLTTLASLRICDSDSVFVIVITPEADSLGGDTVVGPGYELGSTSPPIEDVVLPFDDSQNRLDFSRIVVREMKAGMMGDATFLRTDAEGNEDEFYISFAPVKIRALKSVQPNDFSRGVEASESLVHSVGVAILENDLSAAFLQIEEEARQSIDQATAIVITIVVITAAVMIIMTSWISIAITRPLIVLLRIVQDINGNRIQDDIPTLDGGSREVQQVYMSLSRFYRLLRSSNIAFFSGNMPLAYKFLSDALGLFRRASDQKAIGIATNNLANTLFVMHREKVSSTRCRLVNEDCVQALACQHYNEAVEIAREEYDSDSVSRSADLRALFAEQLANRLFNRGVFLSLTMGDACASQDALHQGKRDLMEAKDLDCEVRDYLIDAKLLQNKSAAYFDRLMRRIHGLIELTRNGIILEDVWDVFGLLDEAESLLFVVRRLPESPLFREVSPLGRLQQLESVALEAQRYQGDLTEAAFTGMRMLVEDEYIEASAFARSASALAFFLRETDQPNTVSLSLSLQKMLKECKIATCKDVGKRVVFALDRSCRDLDNRIVQSLADLYSSGCSKNDLVAFVCASADVDDEEAEIARPNPSAFHRKKAIDSRMFPLFDKRKTCAVTINGREGISRSLQLLQKSTDSRNMDTWIVVAVGSRTLEPHTELREKMEALKETSTSPVYLVIIGVHLTVMEAASYRHLCEITRGSVYIDLRHDLEGLDDSIADVRALMTGGGKKTCHVPGGITMEQF